MNNNYKKLYKKYKKKYLTKKQELLNGGLLAMNNDQNSKKCPLNSVYIIPPCSLEYPCLKNDGNCYNFDNISNNFNIDENIINQIFSTNSEAVIIHLNSFLEKKIKILIGNLLGRGGDSNVFDIKDVNDNNLNMVFRMTKNKSLSNEYIQKVKSYQSISQKIFRAKETQLINNGISDSERKKNLDNFQIILNNKVNNLLNRDFPNDEDKYRDFNSMQIQYQLSKSPYINSIIDFGRFRFSLNNSIYSSNLNDVLSTSENQSPIGTYSILQKCDGGDLKTRYDNNRDIYKKINVLKKLFQNILFGVQEIHSKGYVHRDLKPENIGLKYSLDKNYDRDISEFEKNTEIEILDFGLATKSDIWDYPAGTMEFFSPDIQSIFIQTKVAIKRNNLQNTYENKVKKILSKKDDIFAVGIMLFDLIHGYSSIQGEIVKKGLLKNFYYIRNTEGIILKDFEDFDELRFIIFNEKNKIKFIEKVDIDGEEFIFKKLPKFLDDNRDIKNFKYVIYNYEEVRATPIQYDLFEENSKILNDSLKSFLDGMLSIEEEDRFSVEDALTHPWIKTKRLTNDEIIPNKVAKSTNDLNF